MDINEKLVMNINIYLIILNKQFQISTFPNFSTTPPPQVLRGVYAEYFRQMALLSFQGVYKLLLLLLPTVPRDCTGPGREERGCVYVCRGAYSSSTEHVPLVTQAVAHSYRPCVTSITIVLERLASSEKSSNLTVSVLQCKRVIGLVTTGVL